MTEQSEAMRKQRFIESLRACATFLETHEGVRAPRYITMNIFVDTRDDLALHARAASWEKHYNDIWFYLRREFGEDLSLDVTAPRDAVCERRVVGTEVVPAQAERTVEIVEWVCEDRSLLAGEALEREHAGVSDHA